MFSRLTSRQSIRNASLLLSLALIGTTGCSGTPSISGQGGSSSVGGAAATGGAQTSGGASAAGLYALEVVRRSGGWMQYADDDEIRQGIRLLAGTTGIFAETAGGVTIAVLRKLIEEGRLDPGAETVVLNTGAGLKTIDAVADVGPTHRIRPTLREVRRAGLLG